MTGDTTTRSPTTDLRWPPDQRVHVISVPRWLAIFAAVGGLLSLALQAAAASLLGQILDAIHTLGG